MFRIAPGPALHRVSSMREDRLGETAQRSPLTVAPLDYPRIPDGGAPSSISGWREEAVSFIVVPAWRSSTRNPAQFAGKTFPDIVGPEVRFTRTAATIAAGSGPTSTQDATQRGCSVIQCPGQNARFFWRSVHPRQIREIACTTIRTAQTTPKPLARINIGPFVAKGSRGQLGAGGPDLGCSAQIAPGCAPNGCSGPPVQE